MTIGSISDHLELVPSTIAQLADACPAFCLDSYVVLERLGMGGSAVVYKVRAAAALRYRKCGQLQCSSTTDGLCRWPGSVQIWARRSSQSLVPELRNRLVPTRSDD